MRSTASRWPLLAVAAVHLAGILSYFPPSEMLSGEPLLTSDYAYRFIDSEHTASRLASGASYGYSTRAAAGYPTGLAGWFNHKPFILLFAVTPDAVHPLAFNLTVSLALWIPVLFVYATARRFGLDALASSVTAGLFLCAWYGSTLFRFFWGGGSVLFIDSAVIAFWAIAVVHEHWSAVRAIPFRAVLAAAVVPWIHPLGCGVLAVGFVGWWLSAGTDRHRRFLAVSMIATVVVVANAPWLWIVWRQSPLRGALWYPVYLGGFQSLLFDLVKGPLHLGPAYEEAAVLSPLLVAAIAATRDVEPSARRVLSVAAAGLAVASYFGSALGLRFFQPYRFAIPLTVALSIMAAPAFVDLIRLRGSTLRFVLTIGLALVLADRIRIASAIDVRLGAGLSRQETWALGALRAHQPEGGWRDAGRVLAECELGVDVEPDRPTTRRVQYSFAALERYLPAEFLGCPLLQSGTPEEPLSFWLGNLLWRPLESYDAARFGEVLDLYDVGFVITVRPETRERLATFAPRLTLAAAERNVGLFVVDRRTSRVRSGPGHAWSDGDTVFFETDRAEPSVLRYHWVDGLASEPAATVLPAPERPRSASSFIEIRPVAPGRYRIGLPRG